MCLTERNSLGRLEFIVKLVYENSRVKGYANYKSFVPDDYFCLLGINVNDLCISFGDQFGDRVFLFAISQPSDRDDGLPTAFLYMKTHSFKSWLCQLESNPAVQPSGLSDFSLCSSEGFIEEIRTMEQSQLLGKEEFRMVVQTFVSYMLDQKKMIGDTIFNKSYLGIEAHKDEAIVLNQEAISPSICDPSEGQKKALEDAVLHKRSLRERKNISYGPLSTNKVPIEQLRLAKFHADSSKSANKKPRQTPSVSVASAKKPKDTSTNSSKTSKESSNYDYHTHTKRSQLQFAEMQHQLQQQSHVIKQLEIKKEKPALATSYDPIADSINSRNILRDQKDLDFNQSVAQVKDILSIAREISSMFNIYIFYFFDVFHITYS